MTIDHILVDRRAKIGEVSVYDLEGSDHRPVLVDVGLVPDTGAAVADRDADRDEALLRWATSDRRLIQRMLSLTPEERLRGLARAAAFFAAARRA